MRPNQDKRSIRLFYLLKKLNKCHREHSLLENGDRIAVALSGGNVFAELMDTVRTCSLGQITQALFKVGGKYRRNM